MDRLEPGDPDQVGGHRLVARLGAGGMGVVYLGRSPGGRAVAVKVVRERFAGDPEFRARFRREVAAAHRVTGTFIAPILDSAQEATTPWLVTAYLPGLSVREAVNAVGPLPPGTTRVLAIGLAEALAEIHRAGLVHRDLKPSNVILTADGPRVIDFGIARPDDATAITGVGAVIGTPGFMSPEQAAGQEITSASDIYALGALLAFAATGQESPTGITDPWLRDVVTACLREDPDLRPSAADLAAKPYDQDGDWLPVPLGDAIARRAAEARDLLRSPASRPLPRPSGSTDVATLAPATRKLSRRTLIAFGGAAVLAAAGGTAALLTTSDKQQQPVTTSPSPKPVMTTTTSKPPPQATRLWQAKVSGYYSEVYVSGGTVIAVTDEQKTYGLDPQTGERRWEHASGDAVLTLVTGDTVFLDDPVYPKVTTLDPASGRTRWSYEVPFTPGKLGDAPNWKAVCGSVLCCGGEYEVRALGVADGRTRWVADVSPGRGLAGDADIVVALGETALVAMDPANGRTRWTYPVDHGIGPEVSGGLVYLAASDGLYVLRADTGTLAWQNSTLGGEFLASSGGKLYVGLPSAYDAATGTQLWSNPLNHDVTSSPRSSTVRVDGDTLYVGSVDHHLYAVNAADGRVLWTYPADLSLTSAPATSGNLVFVGTRDGNVECVRAPA